MANSSTDITSFVGKQLEQDDVNALREGVRVLAQAVMETAVSTQIGAAPCERSSKRVAYRNGYRTRRRDTRVGTVELKIPKVTAGAYFPSLLEPRRRAEKALQAAVVEADVKGVSTRKGQRPGPGSGDRQDLSLGGLQDLQGARRGRPDLPRASDRGRVPPLCGWTRPSFPRTGRWTSTRAARTALTSCRRPSRRPVRSISERETSSRTGGRTRSLPEKAPRHRGTGAPASGACSSGGRGAVSRGARIASCVSTLRFVRASDRLRRRYATSGVSREEQARAGSGRSRRGGALDSVRGPLPEGVRSRGRSRLCAVRQPIRCRGHRAGGFSRRAEQAPQRDSRMVRGERMAMENPTVVFRGPGEVLIEDRELPTQSSEELLIKTRCSLISTGTELTVLGGDFPPNSAWAEYCPRYPFLPGYDNIGEVIGVGDGVDRSWMGRRVATQSPHALFVTSDVGSARSVPEGIADEDAAFFTIAEIVMNGIRRGGVQWGDSVVVYGVGLLGQFTVRFVRLCGARPVFAVDTASGRLERIPSDPVVIPVDPRDGDLADLVKERTGGHMADVVFEVTGNPDLIPGEFDVLHSEGRMVMLSSPRGKGTMFNFHDLCNSPSHTIIGAHVSSHPPMETPATRWTQRRHAELFFDLIATGEVHLDDLLSHRVRYQEAPAIYGTLLEDRTEAMGVVLDWSE